MARDLKILPAIAEAQVIFEFRKIKSLESDLVYLNTLLIKTGISRLNV